jgi:hypothetical protein
VIEPKSKDIKDIKDIKDRLEVNFGEAGFPSVSQGIPDCDSCSEQVGADYRWQESDHLGENEVILHSSFFILHSL